MVVGENAAVEARRGQAADIFRIHPVVDALRRPGFAAGRHAGLQIYDAHIRRQQRGQRVAPHVAKCYRLRKRVGGRQFDVVPGVAQVAFENRRASWVGQDLVNAASRHHIAAQHEGNRRMGRRG